MSDTLLDAPPVTEQDDGDAWLIAWALLLLLLGANAARPLTATQRKRARDLLRMRFENAALRYAQRVTSGGLDVDQWQAAVGDEMASYTRTMAVAGAGTLPNAQVRQLAESEIRRQMPFLAGFAAALAGMSIAAIANRTRLYGGVGWGMFWRAQGSTASEGIVERWISRDDNRTCSVCASFSGRYYLPGVGPMPGAVCLGAGNCRCERVQVVDRVIWQRLAGR